MLFLPDLIPRNVQLLAVEADEELFLIQQEAQLKFEVDQACCVKIRSTSR